MRILRYILALVSLMIALSTIGSGPSLQNQATGKIDSRIQAVMANGGTTSVLVLLRDQADLSPARILTSKQAKGRFVFETLRAQAERTQAPVRAALDRLGLRYRSYYVVNAIAVEGASRTVIEQIAARIDVQLVESNAPVKLKLPVPETSPNLLAPSATGNISWGVSTIKAPAVWSMGIRGRGIVIAGADTGIQWSHPALKTHYRGYVAGAVDHNYNWWDAVHADVSGNGTNPCGFSSRRPCDDYGHGTHTIGTAIGDDGYGNRIGVAPGARWIGCRNMEEGYGTPAQYIECFQFFLAPTNLNQKNPDPSRNADVINNSWECTPGEGCTWATLQATVEAVRAAGIFVVASAGNSGYAGCGSVNAPPALYDATFTAGATDNLGALAGFSSRGPVTIDGSNRVKPDLSAPGVAIRSAFPRGVYATMSGTSMAAPHVAGAIALLWQARPRLKGQIDASEQALLSTAGPSVLATGSCGGTDATMIPNNLFGYGVLNIAAAVKNVPK